MQPFEQAWTLLKGRQVYINDEIGFVPVSQQTLHGESVAERGDIARNQNIFPERRKTNTGLDYHVTVPREDLREDSNRRYAIRRGDTNEIVGDFPMTPIHEDGRTIGHKPMMTNVEEEHRGQNLYARALMSLLSAPEAGTPVVSNRRNMSSQHAHAKLMGMYQPHPHSSVQLTPTYGGDGDQYEDINRWFRWPSERPIGQSDEIIYHPLADEGYGSLRSRDPGGLPLRVIDLPSNQTWQLPGVQSTLDDF